MRCACLLLAAAALVRAGSVQGTIFDEETRNPLARTRMTLMPLPGNKAPELSMPTNDHGVFLFADVAAGWYVLRATRLGYATCEVGQSRPGQPGRPFEVTAGAAESYPLVMRRQAAITGSVVDDNAIGIPSWPVTVYTARQPNERVADGTTDDRGNFRIGELDPGAYIVRAGGGLLDESVTLVPSYAKYGTAVASADTVRVRLGETVGYVVIHTVEGQLFELGGNAMMPAASSVRVTMMTDSGRQVVASAPGPWVASQVAPGAVDLLTEGGGCASFQRVTVDRNMSVGFMCAPLAAPVVTGAGGEQLIGRRVDLNGRGPERVVGGEALSPGFWEFTVRPAAAHYLMAMQDADVGDASPAARDGWFPMEIGNAPRLRVVLSDKPGTIAGVVSSQGKVVAGAPVYLEQFDSHAPEVVMQSWTIRADASGKFDLHSLGPGSYRVLSSFEVDMADPVGRNAAVTIEVREGETVQQGLELVTP